MPWRRELLRCTVVGVAVATALGAGALAWSSTLLGVPDTFEGLRAWLEAPPSAPAPSASAP